jgi:SsrA-binding protein
MAKSPPPSGPGAQKKTLVCQNRRAKHDITIEERLEAGLMLVGTEVKALRAGLAHLNEAYVQIVGGNAVLIGGHIGEYSHGNQFNHAPSRSRRLLLNRKEIDKLERRLAQGGATALPLSIYFDGRGRAKLEVGVGAGKSHRDRRQDIKAREADREVARVLQRRNKGV